MTWRVLRWEVPVDDRTHAIGTGEILHVACRPPSWTVPAEIVEVWTRENCPDDWPATQVPLRRKVRVFGTAQPLPDAVSRHLGSALDAGGALVWHLFEMREG